MDTITINDPVIDPQKVNDFKGRVDPDWCPGCGDFGVLNCLRRACLELERKPHEILTISGIGCSSNFPGFFNSGVSASASSPVMKTIRAFLRKHHSQCPNFRSPCQIRLDATGSCCRLCFLGCLR